MPQPVPPGSYPSAAQSKGKRQLKVAEKYIGAFGNLAKQGNTLILLGDLSNMGSMVAAAMQVVKQGKA